MILILSRARHQLVIQPLEQGLGEYILSWHHDKPPRMILIINPNTTKSMTDALKPLVASLQYDTTHFEYFTAPCGVPSINNEDDAARSAQACLPSLLQMQDKFDGFLVCCYSQHPLVAQLRAAIGSSKVVTGIFEASIAACLQSLNSSDKFGIVSTGMQWDGILGDGVAGLLGSDNSSRYAGTETTGLDADELHSTAAEEVRKRMMAATKRLLVKGAKAVCLGCAGMVGMDRTVREACVQHLGEVAGRQIKIIDGVVSGVVFLDGVLRAGY